MVQRRRILIGVTVLAAPAAAWFLAVDWSWFEEFCPDCLYRNSIGQYRALGITLSQNDRPSYSVTQRLSADLGTPCTHPKLERWHKHRWWGLVFCRCPCINGTISITGDDRWYDERLVAAARSLAVKNPALGKAFYERVVLGRDKEFADEVLKKVRETAGGT